MNYEFGIALKVGPSGGILLVLLMFGISPNIHQYELIYYIVLNLNSLLKKILLHIDKNQGIIVQVRTAIDRYSHTNIKPGIGIKNKLYG